VVVSVETISPDEPMKDLVRLTKWADWKVSLAHEMSRLKSIIGSQN